MLQKIFVSRDNMVTIICPKCEKPRRADVSKFGCLNQAVRIKVKCPCGHRYEVELERRQYQRKAVNFPGVVFRSVAGVKKERRVMVVKDLSRTGLKLHVHKRHNLAPGDTVLVDFRLDDALRSTIRREAVVGNVSGLDISVKFTCISASDPNDKALGFYFLI